MAGGLKKEPSRFSRGGAETVGRRASAYSVWRYAKDAKPFKGVGSGVLEIALRYASDAYRVVLAVHIGWRIYVLHAFQKKAKKGIETPKRDVDLIKKRYAEAQELAHEEKAKSN